LKTAKIQKVSFRAKRDPIQSFGFDAISLNQDFVFGSKKFKLEFHANEEVSSDLEGTRIVREGSRYFLIMPQRKPAQLSENQRLGAVSLDPGVCTFVTFYSEVLHGKMGEGERIYRLCLNLDKLYSKISSNDCPVLHCPFFKTCYLDCPACLPAFLRTLST
jgi:putative transposase